MKKYVTLFTEDDNKSYFKEEAPIYEINQPLGVYSKKIPAKGMMFRIFKAGAFYDWHNAPQPQYIVYLEGEVEVEASGGEKRVFKPGDILFATDLTGKGHISKTLSDGRSIIITTQDSYEPQFNSI
jgi:hypothetical protein